ncbi:MAG: sigma-70 family RNA polymerase sigma factor [Phycisphaerales bacterium]
MTAPNDKTLIRAVLAGDKTAYQKLYDRYAPLVRAVCYDTTCNVTDAQDLAQDVFMRAYEKLENLRNSECFGNWLVGIARLRCKEWRRQKFRNRDKKSELENKDLTIADTPNNGQIERLREMITTLPEQERLALHAFYLQNNSADSARKVLGLSRSGFYRVLERARKRLERLLTEKGDF